MRMRNNSRIAGKKNAKYKEMINEQQNNYEYNNFTIPSRIHFKDDLEEIKRNFLYYDRYFRGLVLNEKNFENLLFQIDVELNGEIETCNTQKNGLNEKQIEDICRKLSAYKQFLANNGFFINQKIGNKLSSIYITYKQYYKKYVESELRGKEILYGDIKNPNRVNISKSDINIALKQLIAEKIYICDKTVYERCCANIREQKREQNEIGQMQDICREKLDKIILDDWNGNLVNIKTGTIYDENDVTIANIIQTPSNLKVGRDYYKYINKGYNRNIIYYQKPFDRMTRKHIKEIIYKKIPAKNFYTALMYSLLNDEITLENFFYNINFSQVLSPEEIINYITILAAIFKKEQEKNPKDFDKDIVQKFINILDNAEYLKKPLSIDKLLNEGIKIKKGIETIYPEEDDIKEAIRYLHEKNIYLCHYTVENACKEIILERRFLTNMENQNQKGRIS